MKTKFKLNAFIVLFIMTVFSSPVFSQVGGAGGSELSAKKADTPQSLIITKSDFFSKKEKYATKKVKKEGANVAINLAKLNALRLQLLGVTEEKSVVEKSKL